MFELGNLCLLQGHIRALKIRAGIDHVLIEPEPIEVIAEIVVMMDVLFGSFLIIGPGPCVGRPQLQQPLHSIRADLGEAAVNLGQKLHQVAAHLYRPLTISISKSNIWRAQQGVKRRTGFYREGGERRLGADLNGVTIPQTHDDPGSADEP